MSEALIALLTLGGVFSYFVSVGVASRKWSLGDYGPLCAIWPLIIPFVLGNALAGGIERRLNARADRKSLPAARVVSE